MSAVHPLVETPQDAARRLFSREIAAGARPEGLHTYTDANGTEMFHVVRLRQANGEKLVRPITLNGAGYKQGRGDKPPQGWPLYRLADLLADPAATAWVVEGETCADALRKLGMVATTTGSCSSADGADWTPLRGRSVRIWPDNDGPGAKYADAVAERLRALGCAVGVLDAAALNLPEKGDCVDWLAANPGATADDAAALPVVPAEDEPGGAHDPCSHLANAHRIIRHFGDTMLFVEGIGWHVWAPPWRHDELGARLTVQPLGKLIAQEAADMAPWVAAAPSADERNRREDAMSRRFKWAGASENATVIEASLRMAAPHLACRAADMDAKPMLLGLPAGVLELDTGTHREHRTTDLLTKTAGCDFDPDAKAPAWERFIAEIMAEDAELIDFIHRLAGYALSGHRGEHLLPICWGRGANGKSTFLGALHATLGDYAGTAAPGLLIQRHGSDHPTGLADLQGRRLVVASETGEAGRLNEEQVKLLTGGDRITARRMRMDFYEFEPTHLLLLQTNHRPRVGGTDEGIWRRLRLIPFGVTIPPEKRDARLPETLRAELPGILAWCWRGWQRYQAEGFNEPEAVRTATAAYRDASDLVGAFLADSCVVEAGATATARELYSAYRAWCEGSGEHPRPQRDFGMRLTERGFERVRYGSGFRWRGLRLADDGAAEYLRQARGH